MARSIPHSSIPHSNTLNMANNTTPSSIRSKDTSPTAPMASAA